MKRHRGTCNAYDEVKEANSERTHTAQMQIEGVREKTKLRRQEKTGGLSGPGARRWGAQGVRTVRQPGVKLWDKAIMPLSLCVCPDPEYNTKGEPNGNHELCVIMMEGHQF